MIRCSKCSTLNRDSSRFCNECGAPLHKTRIRCPQCGTLNPVGNIFCDSCHTRLLPAEEPDSAVRETGSGEETLPRVQGISLPTRSTPAGESSDTGEKAELPDWLMGFFEPESADTGDAAEIDWTSASMEDTTTSAEPLAPSELPDWLSGLAAESASVEAAPESEPVEGLPDWLSGLAAESAPVEAAPEPEPVEGLPDWLSGLAAESAPVEAAPEPEPAEGLPDWLSGLAAESAPVEAAPEPEPAEGLPDWLSGLAAESPPVEAAPELEPVEGLPDWLSGLMDESEGVTTPTIAAPMMSAEQAPMEEELPDWLSGMMAEPEPGPSPVGALAGEPAEQEPPDILEPAALPEWLGGGMDELPESGAAQPTGTNEPPAEAAASLPDWLSAWDEDSGNVEEEVGAGIQPSQQGDEDTWSEGTALTSEKANPEEVEPAEIPDWLRALGPRPDTATEESEPEGLEQAEVPTWLEQYRPPATAPLDPSRAPETPPAEKGLEGGLVRAEIPDWVQQYRPTATSPTAGSSLLDAVATSVSESEGPLSGLTGLLPSLPVVDAPAQLEPATVIALPQSVVQEAQLWQQLLERGTGGAPARPKARKRAVWPSVVVRVLIAMALVLASVLRFSETPLAQPPEQPGVAALFTAIEALSPGARVLVAFEYTPAEVDEMNFIVEALLEHLLSRGVQIIAVSTLPEGAGLIQEHFAWAETRFDLPAGSLVNQGFVAGGVSGVAGILESSDVASDPEILVVITSRSEKLRAWVEQTAVSNGVRAATGKPTLLLAAGVSAAITPQIRPYLEVSGNVGWLSGFSGVAAYWQARGLPPREIISRRLDALLLTQWIAASLLLAGAVFYVLAGKQRTV